MITIQQCVVLTVLSSLVTTAFAGDLAPPAGPIAPTLKTLDDVEPRIPLSQETTPADANGHFAITQPGSYYLTGDVTVTDILDGINIDADDVTIDLCGFTLRGTGDTGSSQEGITTNGEHSNITIRNGIIRDFTNGGGIYMPSGDNCRIDGITIHSVEFEGITVRDHSLITNCIIDGDDDSSAGIVTRDNGIVTDCVVQSVIGRGIVGRRVARIEGCSVQNTGSHGIEIDRDSLVQSCTVEETLGDGIHVGFAHTRILDCTVRSSDSSGINAAINCTISGCVVTGSEEDNVIGVQRISVLNSTISFGQADGIDVMDSCHIEGCMIDGNAAAGIRATFSTTITNNTLRLNFDGIRVDTRNVVTNNVSNSHSNQVSDGAGILITGHSNTIDGNRVSANGTGIELDTGAANNVVTRNIATGNSDNYDLEPGNDDAPLQSNPATAGPWDNLDL